MEWPKFTEQYERLENERGWYGAKVQESTYWEKAIDWAESAVQKIIAS